MGVLFPRRNTLIQDATAGTEICIVAEPGEDMKALRLALCGLAHRTWGKGAYTSAIDGRTVRLTRVARERPVPPDPLAPMAANDAPEDRWVDRDEAAKIVSPWFPPNGLTSDQLRRMAVTGSGPPHSNNGRRAIYRLSDLYAWVAERVRPAPRRRRAA
jgi:hypothetical protein